MDTTIEEYVSIVGSSYLFPITIISESLFHDIPFSQNEVQASSVENGYSTSLCILVTAWFESYTMRVRYLNNTSTHVSEKHCVRFLKELYPDFPFYDELMEVFVLRDTLIHNHLWMINFSWDKTAGMKLREAKIDAFSHSR